MLCKFYKSDVGREGREPSVDIIHCMIWPRVSMYDFVLEEDTIDYWIVLPSLSHQSFHSIPLSFPRHHCFVVCVCACPCDRFIFYSMPYRPPSLSPLDKAITPFYLSVGASFLNSFAGVFPCVFRLFILCLFHFNILIFPFFTLFGFSIRRFCGCCLI